jgi:hypothetical protein
MSELPGPVYDSHPERILMLGGVAVMGCLVLSAISADAAGRERDARVFGEPLQAQQLVCWLAGGVIQSNEGKENAEYLCINFATGNWGIDTNATYQVKVAEREGAPSSQIYIKTSSTEDQWQMVMEVVEKNGYVYVANRDTKYGAVIIRDVLPEWIEQRHTPTPTPTDVSMQNSHHHLAQQNPFARQARTQRAARAVQPRIAPPRRARAKI